MARPSINQVRASSDHAVVFRWNLVIAQFPLGLAGPPTTEELNIRAESVEQPTRSGQTIVNNIRGHQVKQGGIWIYNPVTLVFAETTDNIVNKFIHDWIELSWATKTGVSVTKANLEATVIMQRLNNLDEPIVEFKCVGCIPEAEDKGATLDGATSDVIRPTITLNYDFFERTSLI